MRVAFAFLLLSTVTSCHEPLRPDGEIRTVTARDLVRQYRDDPEAARLAFTAQRIRVLVRTADVDGNDVHYHIRFSDPRSPPVLVFRFDSRPAFKAPAWIEGDCHGRVDDSIDRGLPGYRFSVVVRDCRVVSGP